MKSCNLIYKAQCEWVGQVSQSNNHLLFVPQGTNIFPLRSGRGGINNLFVLGITNMLTQKGGGAFDDVGGGDDDDVDGDDDEVDGEAEEDVSEENILAIIARKLGAGAISHRHP